jgi:DNA polymerase
MFKNVLMDEMKSKYKNCTLCPIGGWAHKHVFGKGHPHPDVLFIGEGPGKMEDVTGLPFVGLAGQLLDQALRMAGGGEGTKDEPFPFRCYFTNLVSCRPCDAEGEKNRPPSDVEISNCGDRLKQTVIAVAPNVVVLLGRTARETLSADPFFSRYRMFCLHHPAYILRQGGAKSSEFKRFVLQLKEVDSAVKFSHR